MLFCALIFLVRFDHSLDIGPGLDKKIFHPFHINQFGVINNAVYFISAEPAILN